MRRVVITGMGVFASTGQNADSFFTTVAAGRSAIRRIQQFDPTPLSVQIAAEIPDYEPLAHFPAKRLDLLDRFSQFALLAAHEAMDSSGLQLRDEERPRFGVVTGTGMAGATTFDSGYYNLYAKQAVRLHPFTIPKIMHNAATSQICMEFGAQGPSCLASKGRARISAGAEADRLFSLGGVVGIAKAAPPADLLSGDVATAGSASCWRRLGEYRAAAGEALRRIARAPSRPSRWPRFLHASGWIFQWTKADEAPSVLCSRPASESFRFDFLSRVWSPSRKEGRFKVVSNSLQTASTSYPCTRTARDRWIASTEMTSV